MAKDFSRWHQQKRRIHNEHPSVFFHEREIWFCHLGENVGFEQDGRGQHFLRPVVIIKKFNTDIFLSVPLTRGEKPGRIFYFSFSFKPFEASTAILSQLRLLDSKRLKYKAGAIALADFVQLKTKIRQLFA